jgi:hypothetical protein
MGTQGDDSTTTARRIGAGRASALAILALVLPAQVASAGFIPIFLGNSQPTSGSNVYIVNFAVLDQTGGSDGNTWGADPTNQLNFNAQFRAGTDSPALDTTATYLYLYQVVNDSNLDGPSITLQILALFTDLNLKQITSWGFFGGLGLADDMGRVNADNSFGMDRVNRENPAPINLGVKDPSVVKVNGALPPSTSLTRMTAAMGLFNAQWAGIMPTQYSSIFGFTTDLTPGAPPMDVGVKGSDNTFPLGQVVTVNPEPSGLVLLGLGVALSSRVFRRKDSRMTIR